jgi:phenylalanyl-tRNA synthetase alpha chain
MALSDFVETLASLQAAAIEQFDGSSSQEELEAARVEFLGAKQGKLKATQKQMGSVGQADRPQAGKKLNEVKSAIDAAFESAKQRLESGGGDSVGPQYDVTIPGHSIQLGRLHPITQTIEELKDIMGRLGFTVAEGPEIEDDWHNFEALNISREHPARDPLDNFYMSVAQGKATDKPCLLRSQTSTVQIRVMEKTKPPIRIISLGRVYRPDDVDATHYPMFHQMEGLMLDEHVTMSDLKSVLRLFATSYLGGDVHIRFRPSFFPFTEPSVEADYYWDGRWVEFGGAGMVDPAVLTSVGYDPENTSGFAFGLGIERLCMMRHNIKDIRNLFNNDVRFLSQF